MIIGILKNTILIVVILLASQIPVNGTRICDHVGTMISVVPVKNTLRWFAAKFDFREETKMGRINPTHDQVNSKERAVLSGLLKVRQ